METSANKPMRRQRGRQSMTPETAIQIIPAFPKVVKITITTSAAGFRMLS
jgi:hypothetical protein